MKKCDVISDVKKHHLLPRKILSLGLPLSKSLLQNLRMDFSLREKEKKERKNHCTKSSENECARAHLHFVLSRVLFPGSERTDHQRTFSVSLFWSHSDRSWFGTSSKYQFRHCIKVRPLLRTEVSKIWIESIKSIQQGSDI